MISAAFIVAGQERETRQVSEEWLERARESHENVLLADGNPYCVVKVEYDPGRQHARVELAPPEFTRAQ